MHDVVAVVTEEGSRDAVMRERRQHYGMTHNDFEYVRRGLMTLRRDNFRRFNRSDVSQTMDFLSSEGRICFNCSIIMQSDM